MQRRFVLAGALALTLAILVSGVQADDKDKEKPKNIKEIMKKTHAGATAYKALIGKAVKDKKFDDDAKATMKAWTTTASFLGDFDPPKGEKDGWKKAVETYQTDVKALAKAVEDKDEKAASTAFMKVDKGCGACHSKHKGK